MNELREWLNQRLAEHLYSLRMAKCPDRITELNARLDELEKVLEKLG